MNPAPHKLKRLLAERIAVGLHQQSITTPAEWAENYRVMGGDFAGPWTTKHHPWLHQMLNETREHMCAQKAAQMGVTEVALNKTFAAIDLQNTSVLYVMPSQSDASDFSSSRFDPALELSPHLDNLFSDVKNVGHKRAGSANLFVRGSRSRSKLKSDPVGKIILDELDEMVQDNIAMIPERMSGQIHKQEFDLSTPTVTNYGINKVFNDSTQLHYMFRCPHCSVLTEFESIEKNLIITAEEVTDPGILESYYICKECQQPLNQEAKIDYLAKEVCEWVPAFPNRNIQGYYINQMYSMVVDPHKLAAMAINARRDEAVRQELFNSKLGLVHEADDARVTRKMIEDCKGNYIQRKNPLNSNVLVTMGVDVGKVLDFEIDEWTQVDNYGTINERMHPRVVREGTVDTFDELYALIDQYRVHFTIIDANPETRLATQFVRNSRGRALMCYYNHNIIAREVTENNDKISCSVNRTSWLDQSLGRFRNKTISLPQDLSIPYYDHLQNLVRVVKKNNHGNYTAQYLNTSADHRAHARNYSEIALHFVGNIGSNQNITGVY